MTVYIESEVVLAYLAAALTYAVFPRVLTIIQRRLNNVYKAANFTRIPTKDVRTDLLAVDAYAVSPLVLTLGRNGHLHVADRTAYAVNEVVLTLVAAESTYTAAPLVLTFLHGRRGEYNTADGTFFIFIKVVITRYATNRALAVIPPVLTRVTAHRTYSIYPAVYVLKRCIVIVIFTWFVVVFTRLFGIRSVCAVCVVAVVGHVTGAAAHKFFEHVSRSEQ